MELRRALLFIFTSISVLSTEGCKDKASALADSSSTSPTTPTTPPSAPAVSTAAPLSLVLYTKYDDTGYVNNLTFEETGTTTCKASTTTPAVTCTVKVPEGRLFLSSFNFIYSRLPSSCNLLEFAPYFYQMSNNAGWIPPWTPKATAVDCSGTGVLDHNCYWGAAPQILSDFPLHGALLYTPDEGDINTPVSKTVSIQSAWALNQWFFGTAPMTGSNRTVASDMDAIKIGTAYTPADLGGFGDEYVANSFRDYTFKCKDHWYDDVTYQITLIVKDEDSQGTSGPVNHFWSWKDLP